MPSFWYCTAINDRKQVAFLLGPFTEEEACREWAYADQVDGGSARHFALVAAACRIDPWAWFSGFGMARMERARFGALNHIFGQTVLRLEDEHEISSYTGHYEEFTR